MFKVNLEQIKFKKGASLHYEHCEDFKPLKISGDLFPFTKPVCVSVDFVNYGDFIDAIGDIEATVEMTCSRCLRKYSYPLNIDFNERYCPDDSGQEDCIGISGNTISLDSQINEYFLLAVPMKPVCSESCKGLCQGCGQDLNRGSCNCEEDDFDPRLAKLKVLLKNK